MIVKPTAPTHADRCASFKGGRTKQRKRSSFYFKRLVPTKSIFLAEAARTRLRRLFTGTGIAVMLLPLMVHIVYFKSGVCLVLLGLFLIWWGRWQL